MFLLNIKYKFLNYAFLIHQASLLYSKINIPPP